MLPERDMFRIQNSKLTIPINKFRGLYPFIFRLALKLCLRIIEKCRKGKDLLSRIRHWVLVLSEVVGAASRREVLGILMISPLPPLPQFP